MNDEKLPSQPLENADLQWQGEIPYSTRFGDIYFSRDGGLEETDYVFIQANRLLDRWRAADSAGQPVFTIAELGFGTGLNFLRTWQLWQELAPAQLRLHFISCEKYPLSSAMLHQALQRWPQLSAQSEALLAAYPDHTPGYHRLLLADSTGRIVTLDLYYGDAGEMLEQQLPSGAGRPCVDAWYCDGFAPRVNPEMWTGQIFAAIAALSVPLATLSSYSVAGPVVRGLAAAGFQVEKRKGHGNKRQMLCATRIEEASSPFESMKQPRRTGDGIQAWVDVAVIGGGLAGCSTAWQLARRGYRVTLLEAHGQIAQGASGNRQAVLQCRLNRNVSPEWHFNVQSYLYASRLYSFLADAGHDFQWHRCGVLTLESAYRHTRRSADPESYAHYATQVLQHLNADEASALAGVKIDGAATWLPDGGWLDPGALCRAYLQHPLITVRTSTSVAALHQEERWRLVGNLGQTLVEAPVVLIANSFAARQLSQTADYPVIPLRGQVSHVPASGASKALRCVVCAESYIAPAWEDAHCAGASYVKNSTETALSEAEHLQNIAGIAAHITSLEIDAAPLAGRAAVRGGSIDYMPMIGRVACESFFEAQEDLSAVPLAASTFLPGLYLNAGHGSHGLATTALAADYLASCISGEALPLQRDVTACIEPVRFVVRRLRRTRPQRGRRGSEK